MAILLLPYSKMESESLIIKVIEKIPSMYTPIHFFIFYFVHFMLYIYLFFQKKKIFQLYFIRSFIFSILSFLYFLPSFLLYLFPSLHSFIFFISLFKIECWSNSFRFLPNMMIEILSIIWNLKKDQSLKKLNRNQH